MDCQEIRPLLDPFVEGELSSTQEQRIRDHLGQCSGCLSETRELEALRRALTRLPLLEPRPALEAQTLAAVRRRSLPTRPLPAWWGGFLAAGAAMAVIVCIWVVAEALASFHRAGGAEFLSLIGSYPHLLLRYPTDTALAVLEALPMTSVALALASALLAGLLGVQLWVTASISRGWTHPNGHL